MPSVTLKWSKPDLDIWAKGKLDRAISRVVKKAGGTAIKALRAEAKRQVRAKSRIRAGYLAEKALPLVYPRGSNLEDMIWTMKVSGKEVPLGEFPVRQTKKGVSVQVLAGRARKVILGAFMAMTHSGRMGVFKRPTDARYPMGHKLGPSVADTMDNDEIISAAQRNAQRVFQRDFARLLRMEIARFK